MAKSTLFLSCGYKKNRKFSKFPKTQNKPIKIFFEIRRGRSELQRAPSRKRNSGFRVQPIPEIQLNVAKNMTVLDTLTP